MTHHRLRVAIAGAFLTLFLGANAEGKAWRGIVPLKSTRADVERLLGKPNALGRYQFENERAYIHYAEGSCPSDMNDCQCLVPNGTVLEIFVNLEVELKFSDLKVDGTKYKTIRSGHLPTIVAYSNNEEGIVYTVDEEDGEVMDISYLPTAKDCQSLIKSKRANKGRPSRLRPKQAVVTLVPTTTTTRERFRARLPQNPVTAASTGSPRSAY